MLLSRDAPKQTEGREKSREGMVEYATTEQAELVTVAV